VNGLPGVGTRCLTAIVLAAGEGKRMGSEVPKPLRLVGGRPMISHVLDALAGLDSLNPEPSPPPERLGAPSAGPLQVVIVVGHGAAEVVGTVTAQGPPGLVLHFAEQSTRRGTGHAVTTALASRSRFLQDLLVLPADTPLLQAGTLAALVATHRKTNAAATVLIARLEDPTGYGRVVRDTGGSVARIVEEADATPTEAAIDEVNTSIYCFRVEALVPALTQLSDANAQGELYLTDTLAILRSQRQRIASLLVQDPSEVVGVNDLAQLAVADAAMRARLRYGRSSGVGIQEATRALRRSFPP
jgi:bifunctional UDP-N-acetylglucosamine pyrophosphorylase/glucosamine-1-phosphate N-acetyltransferase